MLLKNLTFKWLMKSFAGQQRRHKTYRTDLWTWVSREEGEGEMYKDSNMETHITMCKLDSQWEFAVMTQNSNWGSVTK